MERQTKITFERINIKCRFIQSHLLRIWDQGGIILATLKAAHGRTARLAAQLRFVHHQYQQQPEQNNAQVAHGKVKCAQVRTFYHIFFRYAIHCIIEHWLFQIILQLGFSSSDIYGTSLAASCLYLYKVSYILALIL